VKVWTPSTASTQLRFALLWVLLGLCLYIPTLEFGYFADDEIYLAFSNSALRELSPDNLIQLLKAPANPWEFLPVRDYTYWLDLQIFGDDGFGLHFTNLTLYVLSVVAVASLIYEVLRLQFPQRGRTAPLAVAASLGAAVFVLHPVHVEAVAWISGRKDVLAGVLSLASLGAVVRYSRTGAACLLVMSYVLFVLACFSKSSAVVMVIPSLLFLWCRARQEGKALSRFAVCWAGFMIVAAIFAAKVHMHFGAAQGIRLDNQPGMLIELERASRILASLLRQLLFPFDLGLFHDVYQLGIWHWAVTATSLIAVGWAVLYLLAGRRGFIMPLIILLVLVPLLPYLQFIPFSTWSMASERFLFIPVAGLALGFSLLCLYFGSPLRLVAISSVVCTGLSIVTWDRIDDWRSNVSLVKHEYARQPWHYLATMHYVVYVMWQYDRPGISDALRQVVRDDAREMLGAFVELLEMDDQRRQAETGTGDTSTEYCRLAGEIYAMLSEGNRRLRGERDLVFSNFLRSIERHMYYSLGNPRRFCDSPA
jgi:protein O-mannosyl-transferase